VAVVAGALQVMGHPVALTALLFVMPLVYVATVLPISLGGLGVREGVLSGLLMLFAVPRDDAILAAFLLYLAKVVVGLTGVPAVLTRSQQSRSGSQGDPPSDP
jgi:uncharacterized membrane protein YbhN (UPF0104 family)